MSRIVMHMNIIVLFLMKQWFLNSLHAQHVDLNGLQTYISAGVGGIDFIYILVLFLQLFMLSRNTFGDEFSMAKVFYWEH